MLALQSIAGKAQSSFAMSNYHLAPLTGSVKLEEGNGQVRRQDYLVLSQNRGTPI